MCFANSKPAHGSNEAAELENQFPLPKSGSLRRDAATLHNPEGPSRRALLTGAGFVDLQVTEVLAWEDIDTWIDTWETPALERAEIRALYTRAPAEVRRAHPFEIDANGRILDKWRWLIFSCRKPA